jgi:hypothetical protein
MADTIYRLTQFGFGQRIPYIDTYLRHYYWHESIISDIEKLIGPIDMINDMKAILSKYDVIKIPDFHLQSDNLIKLLEQELNQIYDKFMISLKGFTADVIVDNIFKRLDNDTYCFSGGFGHSIYCPTEIPNEGLKSKISYSHWCVRPEYYNLVKPDAVENIALKIDKKHLVINPMAKQERWGN